MRPAKKLSPKLVENKETRISRTEDELGYYMQDFRHRSPLSRLEMTLLVNRYRQGDLKARDKIISHNMRLVASIALSYRNSGVPLSDRIQMGVIGLMHSLKTFDPGRSNLATWATRHIQNEINRGIEYESTTRPFRISNYLINRVRLVMLAVKTFQATFARHPGNEEIYLWIKTMIGTEHETNTVRDINRKDVDDCCRDLIDHRQWRSLDAPIMKHDTDSGSFADIALDPGDDSAEVLEKNIESKEQVDLLDNLVAKNVIKDQDLQLMRLRADGESLSSIGKKCDRSRERIRQREALLLKKVKTSLAISPPAQPPIKTKPPARAVAAPPPEPAPGSLFEGKRMTLPQRLPYFYRVKRLGNKKK